MDKSAVVSLGCQVTMVATGSIEDGARSTWHLAPVSSWVEAYPPKTDTVGLKPGQEKLHYGGSSKRSGLVSLNIEGINECL